jgi:hypothetical protein
MNTSASGILTKFMAVDARHLVPLVIRYAVVVGIVITTSNADTELNAKLIGNVMQEWPF